MRDRGSVHATVVAYLALFAALGGTAWAVATIGPKDIKDNAVHSRHIENGQVKSADVQDESLTNDDVLDSSLSGNDISDGSLGGVDIGEGTVTGTQIGDGTLTGADVQNGTIGGADITDNAVTSADVFGDLSTSDYALDAGTTNLDLGSIAAQTCAESSLIALDEGTFDNDPIALTADDDFAGTPESRLIYETRLVGGAQNAFRIILCNITGAAYDPPSITFQWAILNRP